LVVQFDVESFRLGCPAFADELEWGETFERLEPAGKIAGVYEVAQMSSQLVMAVVVVALDGCLFDGPVHSLHLTIDPRMVGFCQPMLDTMFPTDLAEAISRKSGRQPRGCAADW
jgi:hypothetical protein